MPTQLSLADLDVVHPLAERYAQRLCRTLGRPSHEREDMEQDMLLDLLARLSGFDPARGTLAAFATVCFQHRASRLATRLRREKRERHEASLDDVVPGQEEGNAEMLLSRNCALRSHRPAETAEAARRILAEGGRLGAAMRERMRTLSLPDAALRTARAALELVAP
jgi:DNA-directed RNA polymerase specialized sigma24 family protein